MNYSVFFITGKEGNQIQTHNCCIPSKPWPFFQSRMWPLRCVAFKQQIFSTIKGKFLNKSLPSWKDNWFFLIPPSVCKQQFGYHVEELPLISSGYHKRCAGKMLSPTHQLLVQCTLIPLKSNTHLVLSFQECFSRQLYWRVLVVVSFFFLKNPVFQYFKNQPFLMGILKWGEKSPSYKNSHFTFRYLFHGRLSSLSV